MLGMSKGGAYHFYRDEELGARVLFLGYFWVDN
jgi:hypothetical protein